MADDKLLLYKMAITSYLQAFSIFCALMKVVTVSESVLLCFILDLLRIAFDLVCTVDR